MSVHEHLFFNHWRCALEKLLGRGRADGRADASTQVLHHGRRALDEFKVYLT